MKSIMDYKTGQQQFFAYARTRHQIYLDREAGKPRPWTTDPVLQVNRFTNVFREYDKVTKWFAKHVRDPMKDQPDVLLATVLFRMFNRIETGEAIFCQQLLGGGTAWERYMLDGKSGVLRSAIKSFVGKKGPYTTGAYIISTPPGSDKLDGVLKIVDGFRKRICQKPRCGHEAWYCAARDSQDHPGLGTLYNTWKWLGEFPYLGVFHAYEIVTDLRHTKLLHKAPDILTWANMGPGARRGLNRIHDRRADFKEGRDAWGATIAPGQALTEMQALLKLSRDATYWPQGGKRTAEAAQAGDKWPKWELREVEHTLCEFDKYVRTYSGEGKPRGVFR